DSSSDCCPATPNPAARSPSNYEPSAPVAATGTTWRTPMRSVPPIKPLCYRCYPGAGDDNRLCDRHFREVSAELRGETIDYSHTAVVQQAVHMVVPKRHWHADPVELHPDLALID